MRPAPLLSAACLVAACDHPESTASPAPATVAPPIAAGARGVKYE